MRSAAVLPAKARRRIAGAERFVVRIPKGIAALVSAAGSMPRKKIRIAPMASGLIGVAPSLLVVSHRSHCYNRTARTRIFPDSQSPPSILYSPYSLLTYGLGSLPQISSEELLGTRGPGTRGG